MQGVILASGIPRGRLPHKYFPKPLIPLAKGITILDCALGAFSVNEIDDVVVVVGFQGQILKIYVRTLGYPIKVIDDTNWEQGHSIPRTLNDVRDRLTPPLIIIHGDLVFDQNLIQEVQEVDADIVGIAEWRIVKFNEKGFKALLNEWNNNHRNLWGFDLLPQLEGVTVKYLPTQRFYFDIDRLDELRKMRREIMDGRI